MVRSGGRAFTSDLSCQESRTVLRRTVPSRGSKVIDSIIEPHFTSLHVLSSLPSVERNTTTGNPPEGRQQYRSEKQQSRTVRTRTWEELRRRGDRVGRRCPHSIGRGVVRRVRGEDDFDAIGQRKSTFWAHHLHGTRLQGDRKCAVSGNRHAYYLTATRSDWLSSFGARSPDERCTSRWKMCAVAGDTLATRSVVRHQRKNRRR